MTEQIQLPNLSFDPFEAARNSRGILARLADSELEDLVRRYRMFLLLKARNPKRAVAPTEIIDEMWHLHMLHPVAYHKDCMELFGRILDHKPGFGSTAEQRPKLMKTFSSTAEMWEREFGEPYCPTGDSRHRVIVCADEEEDEEDRPDKVVARSYDDSHRVIVCADEEEDEEDRPDKVVARSYDDSHRVIVCADEEEDEEDRPDKAVARPYGDYHRVIVCADEEEDEEDRPDKVVARPYGDYHRVIVCADEEEDEEDRPDKAVPHVVAATPRAGADSSPAN